MAKNFAVIGVAGFIAPRHLKAIKDTGQRLVAALDPFDSVGILDSYFPQVKFFTEAERFERHIEKLRRSNDSDRVDIVSICSPNYLHDAHMRLALRNGADALCEKPLVINPWNLDALEEMEAETGRRVYTVLQLRVHDVIQNLKKTIDGTKFAQKPEVDLTYVTRRGGWYQVSWKGSVDKSGGVIMNIGVHFFDLLMWLFGAVEKSEVHLATPEKASGYIELAGARVRWFLSVDSNDLPESTRKAGKTAFRSISIDKKEVEFSEGFTDLHTKIYDATINGRGFGIKDARPSIDLIHQIRHAEPVVHATNLHPFLKK